MTGHHNALLNPSATAEVFRGPCSFTSFTMFQVYTISLILLAIISTVENLIVVIVICKNKDLRTPSLFYLGILAGSDLVTGIIVTPLKAYITQHVKFDEPDEKSTSDHVFVQMFVILYLTVVILSTSTINLISFDRFFYVYLVANYNPTKKKMLMALLCLWLAPLVFIMLEQFGAHGNNAFTIVYFFASATTVIFAYVAMVIMLRKREDTIGNQRKAVTTVLVLIVLFIVMTVLPIFVALLSKGIYSTVLCAVTYFMVLANSAINPLIYCSRIPILKHEVLKLLKLTSDPPEEKPLELQIPVASVVEPQPPPQPQPEPDPEPESEPEPQQASPSGKQDNLPFSPVGSPEQSDDDEEEDISIPVLVSEDESSDSPVNTPNINVHDEQDRMKLGNMFLGHGRQKNSR